MKRRNILLMLVLLVLVAAVLVGIFWPKTSQKVKYRVGITQFVPHPALDDLRMGIESYLRSKIEFGEIELIYRNADGDFSAAAKIAQDFCTRNLDVVVPITTVSAQPVAKACREVPIVFAGVTDPIGAGLVPSLTSPGGNITGTSDLWPFVEQFAVMVRVVPEAKKLGYLYNPGESQAQFALKKVREAAANAQLQLVERQVDTSGMVRKTALEVASSVDLFYYGMDNTVGQAFDSLLKVCRETQKPLFAGDSESVKKGALLCLGIDHRQLGIMTGKIVEQILFKGQKPGDIPVWQVKSGSLYYNSMAFQQFGIKVPEFVLERGKDLSSK